MTQDQHETHPSNTAALPPPHHGLHRIEHYALYIINGMAAGGSSCLSDADIDYAIDIAERLAKKMLERGHIQAHEKVRKAE